MQRRSVTLRTPLLLCVRHFDLPQVTAAAAGELRRKTPVCSFLPAGVLVCAGRLGRRQHGGILLVFTLQRPETHDRRSNYQSQVMRRQKHA